MLIIANSLLFSQRLIDRMIILNPLSCTENHVPGNKLRWINSIKGWGEFGKYAIVRDTDHAWYQKLGLFMEFFRTGDHTNVMILGSIEFIADPDNDIKFNPRAIFWEEGILYTYKLKRNFLQLGYYHRCKHDIDNLAIGEERSLIYGSILGKYIVPIELSSEFRSLLAFRTDIYTIKQDSRLPAFNESFNPNYRNLTSSIGINFNIRNEKLIGIFGTYFHSFFSINSFSDNKGFFSRFGKINSASIDGGLALGIFISGNALFCAEIRYEYFSDTGINPKPDDANLISIGFMLSPKDIW